jgi:hypothetical protein
MLAAPKLEERRRILFVLPVFVYTFSQASAEEDLLYLPQMWSASACWCCQLASSLDNALRWKPDRPSQETDGCNGSKLPGPQAPASWCTPHHSPPRGRACLSRYTRARRPRHPPEISRRRQDRAMQTVTQRCRGGTPLLPSKAGERIIQRRACLSRYTRAGCPRSFPSFRHPPPVPRHRRAPRPPSPVTARAARHPSPLTARAPRPLRPVGAQPRIAVGGAKRNLRSPPH